MRECVTLRIDCLELDSAPLVVLLVSGKEPKTAGLRCFLSRLTGGAGPAREARPVDISVPLGLQKPVALLALLMPTILPHTASRSAELTR